MIARSPRAGRWPLALTIALLGSCADEPTAPTFSAQLTSSADVLEPFVVANTNDNGIGSLRWVLRSTTGGETIRFDPGLAGQTIVLDSAIYLSKPVTIEGPQDDGITISAGGKQRIFFAQFSGTLTLRNLSLTGGYAGTSVGGAIYATADLVIENSTFHGNDGGAGVVMIGGDVTLTNSTVSNNTAANISTQVYGAVMGNTVTLINSTVAHNGYGGVGQYNGHVVLRNSIVANNFGKNCVRVTGTVALEGKNISDDDSCGTPSQILIGDPMLEPLSDNGGPTMTHALAAGSPAINTGTSCTVQKDQRYMSRDAQCDLGAFEFADFTTVAITIDPSSIVKQSTGWAVLTGTVTCSRDETFDLALELAQTQRSGKTSGEVHAAATLPVQCTTTPRMWSASMVLTEGAFQSGTASAKAQAINAEPWVAPASASGSVKLFRSK